MTLSKLKLITSASLILTTLSCAGHELSCSELIELKNILYRNGSSAIIDEAVNIEYLGGINNGSDFYHVYYYRGEFGKHRLAQKLIFVTDNKEYVGMYSIGDRPISVKGSRILFEYDASIGNEILLTGEGLPQRVLLDGLIAKLFK